MSRTKRPTSRPGAQHHDPHDGVRRALDTVKKYHGIGKEAVAAAPEGAKNDGQTIKRLAEREDVSTALIRQARLFARLYDTEEKLEELLALRNPQGMPLTWKHVQQFFLVEDEDERTSLQGLAAGKGWSASKLREVARAKRGDVPSSGGGRRFRKAEGPQEALRKLVDLSRPWLKYYQDIGADSGQSILIGIAEAAPGEHDAEFLEQIREAKDTLREVERAARKAAGRLQAAESKAQQHQTGETKDSPGKPAGSQEGQKRRPAR